MSHRRRRRWFRRLVVGLAFATFAAPAAAKFDEGGTGSRYVTAGGWSGPVDIETGVPLSAGLVGLDEPSPQQVIPYLSQGILTEADARVAAAEAIHDPFLTDVTVRQGESLGGPDGQAPPNRVERALSAQPQVIPYLSHGILTEEDARAAFAATGDEIAFAHAVQAQSEGAVGSPRPDDRGERFSHSDVASVQSGLSSSNTAEWNQGLAFALGAVVLALALGLALGYLSRPRLAGSN